MEWHIYNGDCTQMIRGYDGDITSERQAMAEARDILGVRRLRRVSVARTGAGTLYWIVAGNGQRLHVRPYDD